MSFVDDGTHVMALVYEDGGDEVLVGKVFGAEIEMCLDVLVVR